MIAATEWQLPAARSKRPPRPESGPTCSKEAKDLAPPINELRGHGNVVVQFSRAVRARWERDGGAYLFELPELGERARGESWEEAQRNAADRIAADVNRLTRALPTELDSAEQERKRKLLRCVDLLAGELGIDFPRDRWLLGRVEGDHFVPVQKEIAPIPVSTEAAQSVAPQALCMARVATHRDGVPTGEVIELTSAPGHGREPPRPQ